MTLLFVDLDGEEGRIEDDLSVTYFGRLDVEESIREIAHEVAEGVDLSDELITRLPQELPIRTVERR